MARDEMIPNRWTVGPYEIQEVEFHGGHPWAGRTMYRYTIDGQRVDSELYPSLDRALVSAVGARHMGPRGAGGNAVGTAADWFCVMVGIKEDEERPAPPAVPQAPATCPGSGAGWMTTDSAVGGWLAKCRHCGVKPLELGVSIPELVGNVYLGLVPPHTVEGKL